MKRLLISPDPESFISGGNLYNRRLVKALRGTGHELVQLDWDHGINLGIGPQPDFILVDSQYLELVRGGILMEKFSAAGKGLLCHYIPGMEDWGSVDPEQVKESWGWLNAVFAFMVVPSPYVGSLLRDRTGYPGPIYELPPILGRGPNRRPARSPGTLWAIMAANYLPLKGILPFLEALAEAGSQPLQASLELTLFGDPHADPKYSRACKKLIESSDVLLGTVRMLPPILPEALEEVYALADLYISSSRFETFGMAACESILHGTPVLALSAGNLPYLVDSEAKGRVYPDFGSLATGLLEYSNEPDGIEEWKARLWQQRPRDQYTTEAVRNIFSEIMRDLDMEG